MTSGGRVGEIDVPCEPRLVVTPTSLRLGEVVRGESASADITVRNDGGEVLWVHVTCGGHWLEVWPERLRLLPKSEKNVTVSVDSPKVEAGGSAWDWQVSSGDFPFQTGTVTIGSEHASVEVRVSVCVVNPPSMGDVERAKAEAGARIEKAQAGLVRFQERIAPEELPAQLRPSPERYWRTVGDQADEAVGRALRWYEGQERIDGRRQADVLFQQYLHALSAAEEADDLSDRARVLADEYVAVEERAKAHRERERRQGSELREIQAEIGAIEKKIAALRSKQEQLGEVRAWEEIPGIGRVVMIVGAIVLWLLGWVLFWVILLLAWDRVLPPSTCVVVIFLWHAFYVFGAPVIAARSVPKLGPRIHNAISGIGRQTVQADIKEHETKRRGHLRERARIENALRSGALPIDCESR